MKMRILALGIVLCAASLPSAAGDSGNAADLYRQHCVGCHGSEVYTRGDRKVASLEGLHRQVQRCELALGLKWFDEEIADMAAYLNEHYYRFAP
jgi:mono/diheme cytochrome c family protein